MKLHSGPEREREREREKEVIKKAASKLAQHSQPSTALE